MGKLVTAASTKLDEESAADRETGTMAILDMEAATILAGVPAGSRALPRWRCTVAPSWSTSSPSTGRGSRWSQPGAAEVQPEENAVEPPVALTSQKCGYEVETGGKAVLTPLFDTGSGEGRVEQLRRNFEAAAARSSSPRTVKRGRRRKMAGNQEEGLVQKTILHFLELRKGEKGGWENMLGVCNVSGEEGATRKRKPSGAAAQGEKKQKTSQGLQRLDVGTGI